MVTLAGVILLIALSVLGVDRSAFLKRHPLLIGLWFGVLAVIANTFSVDVYDMGISVGLIDAPPMIAGLLFGPLPGIVAGLIAAAERALTPLWGVGETTWRVCSAATLFVSIYAAAFRNFVFDHQRPGFLPGIFTVAFGEVLHLGFFFISDLNNFSLSCEVIYASAEPMILGSSLAMLLSLFACWYRNAGKNYSLFNVSPTKSFMVFGFSFILLARLAIIGAERQVDEALELGVQRFSDKMTNIIELFMYRCAQHVMNGIDDPMTCTQEYLIRGARDHGLDEANIVTGDERIIASNLTGLINAPFPRNNETTGEFFSLLDGNATIVTQKFRHGTVIKTEYSRYLAIPFPGRKAFLEVAYSFERLERELKQFFLPAIADVPIYYSGYFLVVDKKNIIINDVRDHHEVRGKNITQLGFSKQDLKNPEKKMFFSRLFGDLSRCMIAHRIGDSLVIAVLPLKDVYWPVLRMIFICGFALFALSLLFRWTLVKAGRNQRMVDELRKKNEEQKEREIRLARSVQTSELKVDNPDTAVYRIVAETIPAREVGGDSYDYFELPDGRVIFGIADVSGKGISAAIFMMKTRTSLRLIGQAGKSVTEFMEGTNEVLCRHNDAMMFVTCWSGMYDPVTQELEYVCAGHNPPFIVKADGTVQMLECKRALPLGVRSKYHYFSQKIHLDHGDRVFLYTDGVTEAMDSASQLFGEKRLFNLLKKGCGNKNLTLVEQVRSAVQKFAGETEQSDDITMLSIRIK